MICPHCGKPAVFDTKSLHIFQACDAGPTWSCAPCDAWVRCKPGTTVPLGPMAEKSLRKLRNKTLGVFDQMATKIRTTGMGRSEARSLATDRLAQQLGIPVAQCDIRQFDAETCKRTRVICGDYIFKETAV